MKLDWHVTYGFGVAVPMEENDVFKWGDKQGYIVLVETPEELELVQALQYVYGNEVNLQLWDRTGITELRNNYLCMFTTWDPFDPNRI